jgi:purine-binding chemotaxis protein CheW
MYLTEDKSRGKVKEMITFRVGGQEFGIDVMSVREIRVWTPATPIAYAPSYVVGMINLRGVVLPIVDFAARLGFPPTEPNSRHAILVAEAGGADIGLLVEGVSEILTVSTEEVQDVPNVGSDDTREFVYGVLAKQGRMISLVSIEGLSPNRQAAA